MWSGVCCRQRDFNLMDRTDVDLKDKWRNITKAIGLNKKMRGFNMAADLVLRVQNCMRLAQVGVRVHISVAARVSCDIVDVIGKALQQARSLHHL